MRNSLKFIVLLAAYAMIVTGCDDDTRLPQPAAHVTLQATEDGAASIVITYGQGLSAQDSANADYAIKSALNVGFDALKKVSDDKVRESERKSNRDMTVITGMMTMIIVLLVSAMICMTILLTKAPSPQKQI